jgi:hypothetical protein
MLFLSKFKLILQWCDTTSTDIYQTSSTAPILLFPYIRTTMFRHYVLFLSSGGQTTTAALLRGPTDQKFLHILPHEDGNKTHF